MHVHHQEKNTETKTHVAGVLTGETCFLLVEIKKALPRC